MPNVFAYIVIWIWPFVCYTIFKKQKLPHAIAIIILASYLLLPVQTRISLPGLPPIEKEALIGIMVLLAMWWDKKRYLKLPDASTERRLIIILLICVVFMVQTNKEPLYYGSNVIPGLTLGAWVQQTLYLIGVIIAPFLAGYYYFKTEETRTIFLSLLVYAGTLYSIPMIVEVLLSPQLNVWIYGFFPSSWAQQVRFGGFRPVVFLGHGLYVAAFISLVFGAAIHLNKIGRLPIFGKKFIWVVYLGFIVVICKTVAAIIYAIVFVLGFYFISKRKLLLIMSFLAFFVLVYPYARTHWVPIESINEITLKYSEEKHGSLKFRFDMEDMILEKADAKKYFGWGASGRNHVYSDRSGRKISVPDGYWIIIYSVMGWVGYLALFGLMTFPIFKSYFVFRGKKNQDIPPSIVCCCFLLVLNLVDLIPNSSMNCISALIAGIISGGLKNETSLIDSK